MIKALLLLAILSVAHASLPASVKSLTRKNPRPHAKHEISHTASLAPRAPAAKIVQDPTPAFTVNLEYAVYTSVGFGRTNATSPQLYVTAADWLNPPYYVIGYDVKGKTLFSNTVVANQSEFVEIRTVAARHIEDSRGRHRDVVVAGHELEDDYGQGNRLCRLIGLDASAKGEVTPLWTYEVAQCVSDFVDSVDMLVMSDDGTTVAVIVLTNSTLPHIDGTEQQDKPHDGTPQTQVHVLDAASGRLLYAWAPPAASEVAPRTVSITAHGEYVLATNGGAEVNGYVLDIKNKKLRCPVLNFHAVLATFMNPTGDYIAYGYTDAKIAKWDGKTYTQVFTVPGEISAGSFYLYCAAFSTNNGNPLVSLGWADSQDIGIRVDMVKLDGTVLWTYIGPLNTADQNIPAAMSAHLNYVSVATWGSYDETSNKSPQILAFSDKSADPVISYITPGSMFATDIFVGRSKSENGQITDNVFVAGAGKHVHANTMGNGGDLFLLNKVITY